MRPEQRDKAYLWDMLDAALAIEEFVRDKTYAEYLSDRMLRAAVERCVEIIGEAARRISEETTQSHPEIPWHAIIGQRNVLAHQYDEVLNESIWGVATLRIPELTAMLRVIMPDETGDD